MGLQVSPGTKLQVQHRRQLFQNYAQMKTEDAKSIMAASIPTHILLGGVKGFKPEQFNSQPINHNKGNIQEMGVTDMGLTRAHQISLHQVFI